MILRTEEKERIEETEKDTAKAPHITEASSSAPLKTSVLCKGFFLKQTGSHGPGPVGFCKKWHH